MNKRKFIDLTLVIIIFACAGMTTVYISDLVLSLLSVERWSFAYFALIPLVLMPSHNVLLLFYSLIFGRFNYFWENEKKLFRKIRCLVQPC